MCLLLSIRSNLCWPWPHHGHKASAQPVWSGAYWPWHSVNISELLPSISFMADSEFKRNLVMPWWSSLFLLGVLFWGYLDCLQSAVSWAIERWVICGSYLWSSLKMQSIRGRKKQRWRERFYKPKGGKEQTIRKIIIRRKSMESSPGRVLLAKVLRWKRTCQIWRTKNK